MRYSEILEGVTTPPKTKLGPVFNQEGSSVALQDKLVILIHEGVKEITTKFPQIEVLNLYVIGSSVGYQWSVDGDIDISVIISPIPDKQLSRIDRFTINELNPKYHFGKSPMEFKVTHRTDLSNTDAAFDVLKNQWIKKPDSFDTFLKHHTAMYDPELKKKVELLKNTIDSSLLRVRQIVVLSLKQPADVAGNIQINAEGLKAIQHSKKLISNVKNYRRQVFSTSHPDATWSQQNLIAKMLETNLDTSHYFDILPMLNSIIYSKGIVPLDKLKELHTRLNSFDDLIATADLVSRRIFGPNKS